MSIPSTFISCFIGLASCGYMSSLIVNSLWLIAVDPHRGGSISLRPFAGIIEKRCGQGIALVSRKTTQLLDVIGPNGGAQSLEQLRTYTRVLNRCQIERTEFCIALKIGHDVLGLGFRWILGKAEKIRRVF